MAQLAIVLRDHNRGIVPAKLSTVPGLDDATVVSMLSLPEFLVVRTSPIPTHAPCTAPALTCNAARAQGAGARRVVVFMRRESAREEPEHASLGGSDTGSHGSGSGGHVSAARAGRVHFGPVVPRKPSDAESAPALLPIRVRPAGPASVGDGGEDGTDGRVLHAGALAAKATALFGTSSKRQRVDGATRGVNALWDLDKRTRRGLEAAEGEEDEGDEAVRGAPSARILTTRDLHALKDIGMNLKDLQRLS